MRTTLMKLAVNFSLLEPAHCFHLLVDFGGAAKRWSENTEKKNEKRSKALHFFFSFCFVLFWRFLSLTLWKVFQFLSTRCIEALSQTDLKITKGVALKSNERATNEKLKKLEKSMQNRGRRTCTQVSLLNKTHISKTNVKNR